MKEKKSQYQYHAKKIEQLKQQQKLHEHSQSQTGDPARQKLKRQNKWNAMMTDSVVDDPAAHDLSLVTGLHIDGSHLDHRLVKLGFPLPGNVGTITHHLCRHRRRKKG